MASRVVFGVLLLMCGYELAAGQCGYGALPIPPFLQPRGRILNAPVTYECSWPWVVAIRESVFPFPKLCSGVLIGKTKVITTASCISRFRNGAPPAIVILGEHDITVDFQSFFGRFNETYRLVKSVKLHPDFAGKDNDIAVVRLSEDVTYNDCVLPACLPRIQPADNLVRIEEKCAFAGWGVTSEQGIFRSAKLREARGRYYSKDLCSLIYRIIRGTENPQNTACIEPTPQDTSPCWGDEGGMVVCDEPGGWVLESLITMPSCTDPAPTRGVDLRVPAILDFINNN